MNDHPTPWTIHRMTGPLIRFFIIDANGVVTARYVTAEAAKRIAQAVNLSAVVEAAVDVYRAL